MSGGIESDTASLLGVVTIALHPSGDPSTRGWGPGWPHSPSGHIVPVRWSNGTSPAGGVRSEIVELVTLLGNETIKRGYKPHVGWCWGYDNRAIAGTSPPVASNHSWGLAVDINAPTNPRTTVLVTDMPSWMPDLWNRYGFRWGGDYPAGIKKDAMHYEFMGTPAQALVATAQAKADLVHVVTPPDKPPAPTPGDPPVKLEENMVFMIVGADAAQVYLVSADLKTAVHASATSAGNFRNGGGVYFRIEPADWAALKAAGLTVH